MSVAILAQVARVLFLLLLLLSPCNIIMQRREIDDILVPFSGYNRVVVSTDAGELRRICKCMDTVRTERYDSIVKVAASVGVPVMLVHQSDGFGCNMVRTESSSSSGVSVHRVGAFRAELLLELQILKTYTASGAMAQEIMFYPPRLMEGKTTWHMFGSSLDCPSLFHNSLLHDVIKLDVWLQDGLHAAGMRKKQSAWLSLLYENCEPDEHDGTQRQQHLHWSFGGRCILHIGQSASKAAIAPVLSEQISHDAHCLLASLINSSAPLMARIDEFILTRVLYDPVESDIEECTIWWKLLGVQEGSRLDLILEVDPRYDVVMQVLRVRGSLLGDPNAHSKIRTVCLFCTQHINWSDTRWTKMYRCGLLWLRSQSLGIDYRVKMVENAEGSTNDKHNIHGYKRFGTVAAKLALMVASVALEPLNWFQEELLVDDRFLLQAQNLEAGVLERCDRVASLPDYIWQRLVQVGGLLGEMSPWEVRNAVLSGMRRGNAYLGHEGFEPTRRLPLSLTQGDIAANLQRLAEEKDPLDEQTEHILMCWRFSPGPLRTIEALTLLAHSP